MFLALDLRWARTTDLAPYRWIIYVQYQPASPSCTVVDFLAWQRTINVCHRSNGCTSPSCSSSKGRGSSMCLSGDYVASESKILDGVSKQNQLILSLNGLRWLHENNLYQALGRKLNSYSFYPAKTPRSIILTGCFPHSGKWYSPYRGTYHLLMYQTPRDSHLPRCSSYRTISCGVRERLYYNRSARYPRTLSRLECTIFRLHSLLNRNWGNLPRYHTYLSLSPITSGILHSLPASQGRNHTF